MYVKFRMDTCVTVNTGKHLIVVAGTAATLIVSLLSFILPYVN